MKDIFSRSEMDLVSFHRGCSAARRWCACGGGSGRAAPRPRAGGGAIGRPMRSRATWLLLRERLALALDLVPSAREEVALELLAAARGRSCRGGRGPTGARWGRASHSSRNELSAEKDGLRERWGSTRRPRGDRKSRAGRRPRRRFRPRRWCSAVAEGLVRPC